MSGKSSQKTQKYFLLERGKWEEVGVQKRAIRTINKAGFLAHTADLFKNSKILPLDKLIIQGKLHFMHSVEYNYCPNSFINIWQKNSFQNPNLNLRNGNNFFLTAPRTESFKRIPLYSLPLEWNNLNEIKYQFNRTTFRIALKGYLLES